MPPYTSKLLVLLALIVFVLAAVGRDVLGASPVEMVAAGLALFQGSFLVP